MSTNHQTPPEISHSLYDVELQVTNGSSYVAPTDANRYYLEGDTGDDTLTGGKNNDVLWGGLGTNHLNGGGGNDWFISSDAGSGPQNIIDGGAGQHDVVDYSGAQSAVSVDLGVGAALVIASGGFHVDSITNVEDIIGSGWNDFLTGDSGVNTLSGGVGADTIEGGAGADIIDGLGAIGLLGPNFIPTFPEGDTASYVHSSAGVTVDLATGTGSGGDAEGDVLRNIQNITGSDFNDTLKGDGNMNVLDGGKGDDVLRGGGGADTFIGGDGDDKVIFENAQHGVTVDLAAGTGTGGDGATLTFETVEDIDGSTKGDVLTGDKGANVINGGGGNDTIQGGHGNDTLTGGAGDDIFKYHTVGDSDTIGSKGDVITDFTAKDSSGNVVDLIDLHDILGGTGRYLTNTSVTPAAGDVTSHYDQAANATYVEVYTDSNPGSAMILELTGHIDGLGKGNFIF